MRKPLAIILSIFKARKVLSLQYRWDLGGRHRQLNFKMGT